MGVSLCELMANSNRGDRAHNRTLGLFILIAVSAAFRFFALDLKPPHFDEGINGHFVLTIWRDGFYTYDPTNFHGPLYFYLCHLAEVIMGRGVESFRMMNAVLATLLVFGIFRLREFVGRAAVVAAWLVAVSPAFTFYGRYAIHETLFVLGQVAFVYGRFSWLQRPSSRSIWYMITGLVIMVTTKETFFIFIGTWFIAESLIRLAEHMEASRITSGDRSSAPWVSADTLTVIEKRELWRTSVAAVSVGTFVWAAMYSGFFHKLSGLVDFFRAFDVWSSTGQKGNGHEKPFYYWLKLFTYYEWGLVAGLVVSVFAVITLRVHDRLQRILLLSGFGLWLAYSLIPYKTPWLILGFWPLFFFTVPTFERGAVRHLYRAVCLVAILVSAGLSYALNFKNFADPDEPYVYVQTTLDYTRALEVLKRKVARSPDARLTPIVIMLQDPWPLPYDLSLYPKLRYAKIGDIDKDRSILQTSGLLLIDGSLLPALRNVMPKRFARMPFKLRDAYSDGWALFDYDLFQSVLPLGVEIEEPK